MEKERTFRVNKAQRDAWLHVLEKLKSDVQKWAKENQWEIEIEDKDIEERYLGQYKAPILRIKADNGWLILEPVGKRVYGCEGLVQVQSFPAGNRVKLLLDGEKWRIRTESSLDWPSLWSKKNFFMLARELNRIA